MNHGQELLYNISFVIPASEQAKLNAAARQAEKVGKIPISLSGGATIIADLKKIESSLNSTTKSAKNFGDAIALSGKRALAYSIATFGLYKLSAAIANATQAALVFEKEQAKIAQTLSTSLELIKKQSSELTDISRKYGLFATTVATTYRVLSQAGFSAKEAAKGTELLAKTTLLSTFEDLSDTTEGLISLIRTFRIDIKDAEGAINDINVASKKYAIEADDIIQIIKRAGGTFATAGGSLRELIALSTAVRATTRESAETIGTAYRTIFARLQRPKTIQFFKELGIVLTESSGQLKSQFEIIETIIKGLEKKGIKPGSLKFGEIVEEIGGIRQISKTIPLLREFNTALKVTTDLKEADLETDKDVAEAQKTLAFQIDQLQRNFDQLFIELSQDSSLKTVLNLFLDISNAAVELARALNSIPGLTGLIAGIGLYSGSRLALRTIGEITTRGAAADAGALSLLGRNKGGFVPGIGNRDTELALLTPGEFVVNAESAKKFGYGRLQAINRYASGGITGKTVIKDEATAQKAIEYFSAIFTGAVDNVAKATGISKADRKYFKKQYGSDFDVEGVYRTSDKTIGVEFGKATGKTIAHEIAHYFDNIASSTGKQKFASEEAGTLYSRIARRYLKENPTESKYESLPSEAFARFMEQLLTGGYGKKNIGLSKLIYETNEQYSSTSNKDIQESLAKRLLHQLQLGGIFTGLQGTNYKKRKITANTSDAIFNTKFTEDDVLKVLNEKPIKAEEVTVESVKPIVFPDLPITKGGFTGGVPFYPSIGATNSNLSIPQDPDGIPLALPKVGGRNLTIPPSPNFYYEYPEHFVDRKTRDLRKTFGYQSPSSLELFQRSTQTGGFYTRPFVGPEQQYSNGTNPQVKRNNELRAIFGLSPLQTDSQKRRGVIADSFKALGKEGDLAKNVGGLALQFALAGPLVKASGEIFGFAGTNADKFAQKLGDLLPAIGLVTAGFKALNQIKNNKELVETLSKGAGAFKTEVLNTGTNLALLGTQIKGFFAGGLGTAIGKLWNGVKIAAGWFTKLIGGLSKFSVVLALLAAPLFSSLNSKRELQDAAKAGDASAGTRAATRSILKYNPIGDVISGLGSPLKLLGSLFGADIKFIDNFGIVVEDASNYLASFFIPGLQAAAKSMYELEVGIQATEKLAKDKTGIFDEKFKFGDLGARIQTGNAAEKESAINTLNQILSNNAETITGKAKQTSFKGGGFDEYFSSLVADVASKSGARSGANFEKAIRSNPEIFKQFQDSFTKINDEINIYRTNVELSNKAFAEMVKSTNLLAREFIGLADKFTAVDIRQELLGGVGENTIRSGLNIPAGTLKEVLDRGQGNRLLGQASILGPESFRQTAAGLDLTKRLSSISGKDVSKQILSLPNTGSIEEQTAAINDILSNVIGPLNQLPASTKAGVDAFVNDFSSQFAQGTDVLSLQDTFAKFQKGFDDLISKDLLENLNKLGDKQVQGLKSYLDAVQELDQKRLGLIEQYNDINISGLENSIKQTDRYYELGKRLNPLLERSSRSFGAERAGIDASFTQARRNILGVSTTDNGLTRLGNNIAGVAGQPTSAQNLSAAQNKAIAELNIKQGEALISSFEKQASELENKLGQRRQFAQVTGQIAQNYAFGDSSERRGILRTQKNVGRVLATGDIDSVSGRNRGGVRDFISQFAGAGKLEIFGGKSAEETLADLTVNQYKKKGFIKTKQEEENLRNSIIGKATPPEQKIADEIKKIYGDIGNQENIILEQRKVLVGIEQDKANLFATSVDNFKSAVEKLFGENGDNGFVAGVNKLAELMQNPLQLQIQDTNVVVNVQGLDGALANSMQGLIVPEIVKQLQSYEAQKQADPTAPFKPTV